MAQRKLIDLNPRYMHPAVEDGPVCGIIFDCPACSDHKIRVRFENHSQAGGDKWKAYIHGGEKEMTFENISITPSIDGTQDKICRFHGWVEGGVVRW